MSMTPVEICGFLAFDKEMEANVGKRIRFNPNPSKGTQANSCTFTIIGIQKIWNGQLAYRVVCDDEDNFGRPACPDEITFIQ